MIEVFQAPTHRLTEQSQRVSGNAERQGGSARRLPAPPLAFGCRFASEKLLHG